MVIELPEATANICGHVDNHPNVNGSGGFVRARSGLRVGDIFDSRFSKLCDTEGSVRLPLDVAGEILCLPAHLSVRSKVDLIVPPVFAAAFLYGCYSYSIPNEFGPGPIEDSVLRFLKEHRSCAVWEGKVVWEPYKDELAHLPPFCVAGRDVWMARVPLVCFWLVEKHTPDCVLRQFGMVQEIPPYVDTDASCHRPKGEDNGELEGQTLWPYPSSPEYKHISAVLKIVERLHRITAQLLLEETDGANPDAPEDTGRPSISSTRAIHSHASPAPEFPPPPHASPSPEIPPRTAHTIPDLEIPLPTAHASSHLEILSHTPHTFFDSAHLSFTLLSFDLGYDFSQTPPVMHT
nr:serine/threonine-protein phosphatase 7 long form like [Quercus suber]